MSSWEYSVEHADAERVDVGDCLAQLPKAAVPHLAKLRVLSLAAAPDLAEAPHWNNPVYLKDGTRMLMLRVFGAHCSLRFPAGRFGPHSEEVEAAG